MEELKSRSESEGMAMPKLASLAGGAIRFLSVSSEVDLISSSCNQLASCPAFATPRFLSLAVWKIGVEKARYEAIIDSYSYLLLLLLCIVLCVCQFFLLGLAAFTPSFSLSHMAESSITSAFRGSAVAVCWIIAWMVSLSLDKVWKELVIFPAALWHVILLEISVQLANEDSGMYYTLYTRLIE